MNHSNDLLIEVSQSARQESKKRFRTVGVGARIGHGQHARAGVLQGDSRVGSRCFAHACRVRGREREHLQLEVLISELGAIDGLAYNAAQHSQAHFMRSVKCPMCGGHSDAPQEVQEAFWSRTLKCCKQLAFGSF